MALPTRKVAFSFLIRVLNPCCSLQSSVSLVTLRTFNSLPSLSLSFFLSFFLSLSLSDSLRLLSLQGILLASSFFLLFFFWLAVYWRLPHTFPFFASSSSCICPSLLHIPLPRHRPRVASAPSIPRWCGEAILVVTFFTMPRRPLHHRPMHYPQRQPAPRRSLH